MSADVVCMSLANVPPGEQRSRFLAVGLVDNTVRIISLDPSVSSTLNFKDLSIWNLTTWPISDVLLSDQLGSALKSTPTSFS